MSGSILVVDASVAIKWIVPEEDSKLAETLIGPYRLVAPDLIHAECANILWKKATRGEVSAGEAITATGFVDDFAVQTVSMSELVPLAVDLSLRLDHPAYDCFYLALAVLQECPFVTSDGKLHRKVHAALPHEYAKRCLMLEAFAASSTADRTR